MGSKDKVESLEVCRGNQGQVREKRFTALSETENRSIHIILTRDAARLQKHLAWLFNIIHFTQHHATTKSWRY
jgi:hypothetical protein